MRAQPGNRFVSFVDGATRREIIYTLGRFAPRTVPAAPPAPRLGPRVLAFGFWLLASFFFFFSFLFFSSVRLCPWLLAFGFCALVRLTFGFWPPCLLLLCARALDFWLLASVPPAPARLCAWLLAFGLWLLALAFAKSSAESFAKSSVIFR